MNSGKRFTIIAAIMRREYRRIFENKTFYAIMIVAPLVISLLLASIYAPKVVQDIPISILDADNSAVSRQVIRSLSATRSLNIVSYSQSVEEIRSAMQSGDIQGAVYIPRGTEKRLKSGKSARIVVYQNTANIILGNLILKATASTIKTLSTGVIMKKLMAGGLPKEAAFNRALPIRLETYSLYNPGYNYQNYLVPGLLFFILQLTIMLSAVLLIGQEFSQKTYPKLYRIAGGNIGAIMVGKAMPHVSIHFAIALGIIGILFPAFHIPIQGSLLTLLGWLLYFILTSFFLGWLISVIFPEPLLATEIAIFYNTPAFIFSGYTFPLWAMPAPHRLYAQLMPFTHFLNGYLKSALMSTSATYLWPEFFKLSLFLGGAVLLSYGILKLKGRSFLPETIIREGDVG